MIRELQELAKADHQKYHDGRKQLGIQQTFFEPSKAGLVGDVNFDDFVYGSSRWSDFTRMRVQQFVPPGLTMSGLGQAFETDNNDEWVTEEEEPIDEEESADEETRFQESD